MSTTFKIGNIEARRGEKKSGFLRVGETPVGVVEIPLTIVNGTSDGPVLCISGGVHGCEYSSVEAAVRIAHQTEAEKLAGTLLVVPVLNVAGFETRGPQGGQSTPFMNPIDALNMNRIFPGNPEGTMSYQIVAGFMNSIISKANYYIDCHGGDLNEELTPHMVVTRTGNAEKDQLIEDVLVSSFDCDFRYQHSSPTGPGSIDAAARMGIPAIVLEAGGYGRVIEDAVLFITNGINNVMKRLKMIVGNPVPTKIPRIRQRWLLYSARGGLCYSLPLGTRVRKGDKVAEVKSIFGEILETLQSPVDGYICFRRSPLPISTNDRLVGIIPDEDLTPPKMRPYP